MKTYKAKPDTQKEYKVTHKDFNEALSVNKYLLQDNKYYGVCPYCDSPVQLIGLAKEIEKTPHARHTKNNINKVADKTIESIYCPLNTHKRDADPEERLAVITERSLLIRRNFIEIYDVIAKMINNFSDIYYSYEQKLELFKRGYRGKIWLFPEISQSNIPWILLYTESPQEIKTRLIKQNSILYHDMEKLGIKFKDSYVENYSIIENQWHHKLENTVYKLVNHQRKFNGNYDYVETFHARLTHSRLYDDPPVEDYYTYSDKKINVDHQKFYKMINYYNKNNMRDEKLLRAIKDFVNNN